MKIYHVNPDTGLFIGAGDARPDPMEPGQYLVPAHATTTAPPKAGKGKVAMFDDGAWTVIDEPPPVDMTTPSETDGPLDPVIADIIEAVTATGVEADAAKARLTTTKTARKARAVKPKVPKS